MDIKNIKFIVTSIVLSVLMINIMQFGYCADDINSYEYLKIKIENEISFKINKESEYRLDYFNVNSYFFPGNHENSQYLNEFTSNVDKMYYSVFNDSNSNYVIKYYFDDTTLKSNNKIENVFILESTSYRPKIKKKESYPVKYVDENNEIYLDFYDLIDIDDDVRDESSRLAKGEDDVYVISVNIANWIQNEVKYSLASVAENPNQKTTDVFKSRTGVCKEITNLYVSMLRSLGIPSRVVTGYAYTDSKEIVDFLGNHWGGHAWAEVLIDGKWIPFDLTYNQYGYVDASHIVLDKREHIQEGGVGLNGSGFGFDIVKDSLKTNSEFEILDKKKTIYDKGYEVNVDGPDKLALSSYGYIRVKIKNTDEFYKIVNLKVAKTKEVELLNHGKTVQAQRLLILSPLEERIIYFNYHIDGLEPGFLYTLPFTIYNNDFSTDFKVKVNENNMKIKEIALPKEESSKPKVSNNNIEFTCEISVDVPLNNLTCLVKNVNNYEVYNLKLCRNVDVDCKLIDLKLNEERNVFFATPNLNENISFSYLKENGLIELSTSLPVLDVEKSIKDNIVSVNYNIEYFIKGVSIDIYLNDKLFKSEKFNSGLIDMPLIQVNNTIDVKLAFKNKIFDSNSFNIKANISLLEENLNKLNPHINKLEEFINMLIEFFEGLLK